MNSIKLCVVCGFWMWLLYVATECGYCMWLLYVATECVILCLFWPLFCMISLSLVTLFYSSVRS